MNRWECQHPGCKSTAVGCGGAIGLLAIGWYFAPGPYIFCPTHHLKKAAPNPETHDNPDDPPCSLCYGERQAQTFQTGIEQQVAMVEA